MRMVPVVRQDIPGESPFFQTLEHLIDTGKGRMLLHEGAVHIQQQKVVIPFMLFPPWQKPILNIQFHRHSILRRNLDSRNHFVSKPNIY
jgi:hypothetical protein